MNAAPVKTSKRFFWVSLGLIVPIAALLLLFLLKAGFTIADKDIQFGFQNLAGKAHPFDDDIFIETGWDGPTGTFSHGQIYGLRLGRFLLRVDIVEDPIATTKRRLPNTILELITLLKSDDHWTRYCAALVLSEHGAAAVDAIPILIEQLHDRPDAWQTLEKISKATGAPAVPSIVPGLSHPNAETRLRTAELLAELGPAAEAAVPRLEQTFTNSDQNLVLQSALTILKITHDADKVLPTLVTMVEQTEGDHRAGAIFALGEIGLPASNSAPRLIELLSDESTQVRAMSARALGLIGESGLPAIPQLTALLKDPDQMVRMFVMGTLKSFGTNAANAIPTLEAAAANPESAHGAIEALSAIGAPALPSLLSIYQNSQGQARNFAAKAVMKLGADAAPSLPTLLQDLQSDKPGTIALALQVIGSIGEPARSALPEIKPFLEDEDIRIRVRAAQAVWRIDRQTNVALPILIAALGDTTNYRIGARRVAAETLPEMKAAAVGALPALRAAALDEQTNVREDLHKAIRSIETETAD